MRRILLGLLFTVALLCAITWAVHSHDEHSGNRDFHERDSEIDKKELHSAQDSDDPIKSSAMCYTMHYQVDETYTELLWAARASFSNTDDYFRGDYCLEASCPELAYDERTAKGNSYQIN